jgi:hypothetical protein
MEKGQTRNVNLILADSVTLMAMQEEDTTKAGFVSRSVPHIHPVLR